jgi:hypothetical protein
VATITMGGSVTSTYYSIDGARSLEIGGDQHTDHSRLWLHHLEVD